MSEAAAPLPSLDDARFRRRRTQNWLVLGLLYAFFYMSRYNFTANNAYLAEQFHWSNQQLGLFGFVQRLVYGLAVVLNGPLADRVGGKRAFLFGAGGVAAMNFTFGLLLVMSRDPGAAPGALATGMSAGTVLAALVVVWGINGYFQSFGALSIVKVNAQWFHVLERGTFSGVFGVLIRLGLILGNFGTPLILAFAPWQWVFWVPAALVALFFVLTRLLVENTPAEAGFAEFDTGDATGDDGERVTIGYVFRRVFASATTWTVALASMMIGVVRVSIVDDWFGKYFVNVHHADAKHLARFAPFMIAAIGTALSGIAGGFTLGVASDRLYGGRRAPVIAYAFLGMAGVLALFGLSDVARLGPYASTAFLVVLAFFVNGAHGLIGGAASMDFGGKKAAASAAGLFDGMQYLAGALVALSVGWVLDHFGWGAWQWAPIPFALVGAGAMARLWNVRPSVRAH
jgi:OPA family glycerol-3-phosphate transporter-like MFS transporter